MKFENVSILINAIEELIRRSGFYWIDNDGLISLQERVFRVNCMDCLDRTNVVQASIARNILLSIVRSVNLLPMILIIPLSFPMVTNISFVDKFF